MAALTDDELRHTQHPRFLLELFLLQLCSANRVVSLETLWRELQAMEERIVTLPENVAVSGAQVNTTSTAVSEAPESIVKPVETR